MKETELINSVLPKILGEEGAKLYPYQEKFIDTINANKCTCVIKARRAGYTKSYLLHSLFRLYELYKTDKPSYEKSVFVMIFHNGMAANYAETFLENALCHFEQDKFVKEALSHLNLLTPGRVKNWIISRRCRRIEELFLDEYAFLGNVDFLGQLFTSFEIAKLIGVTTLGNGTSNAQKFINNLSPSVIFTPWYECPNLNKNLEWERLGTVIKEPTINKDGDVAYNPEKWRLMISNWWTPTNEWYRKMCELMTPTFKQELNCKNDKRIFF